MAHYLRVELAKTERQELFSKRYAKSLAMDLFTSKQVVTKNERVILIIRSTSVKRD